MAHDRAMRVCVLAIGLAVLGCGPEAEEDHNEWIVPLVEACSDLTDSLASFVMCPEAAELTSEDLAVCSELCASLTESAIVDDEISEECTRAVYELVVCRTPMECSDAPIACSADPLSCAAEHAAAEAACGP
jgi:hypothetical protein